MEIVTLRKSIIITTNTYKVYYTVAYNADVVFKYRGLQHITNTVATGWWLMQQRISFTLDVASRTRLETNTGSLADRENWTDSFFSPPNLTSHANHVMFSQLGQHISVFHFPRHLHLRLLS